MLEPDQVTETPSPGVLVGVLGERDTAPALEIAGDIQQGLLSAFPGRPSLAVVLAGAPHDGVPAGAALPAPEPGAPAPVIQTGEGPSMEAALSALLDTALTLGAPACALLEPMPRPINPSWLNALLDPVLAGDADLVAPAYARRRLEGVLITGIVYPLTRALFGQRLRQPLGREIVISRRLAEDLSRDGGQRSDSAPAGADLWVITKALVRGCRLAQVFLGARPVPQPQPANVSDMLAAVLGALFHGMSLHAPQWQRIRGSSPVPTFGEEHVPDPDQHAPQAGPLVASFALGVQDLHHVWSSILPPQAIYSLLRIPRDPPESFRIPDRLWARLIYDFAVGWRVKAMDRAQLLRSLTPLYLGWVASWLNENASLDASASEERLERLCDCFESEKPYLISRWRWPDRFTP